MVDNWLDPLRVDIFFRRLAATEDNTQGSTYEVSLILAKPIDDCSSFTWSCWSVSRLFGGIKTGLSERRNRSHFEKDANLNIDKDKVITMGYRKLRVAAPWAIIYTGKTRHANTSCWACALTTSSHTIHISGKIPHWISLFFIFYWMYCKPSFSSSRIRKFSL